MNSNSTFDEHLDHALDDALMGTFPASDPIAITVPRPQREPVPKRQERRGQRREARIDRR